MKQREILLTRAKAIIENQTKIRNIGMRKTSSPPLSLQEFMLRNRVLQFYREVMRCCYSIPNKQSKAEMIEFAKGEFKLGTRDNSLDRRHYNLSIGQSLFEKMKLQIGLK